jgi:hypothetical protein
MIIHLISCPRTISTALMYSFAQRKDMQVIDEPFYAVYLKKTGFNHPGTSAILDSQPDQEIDVIKQIETHAAQKHVFVKNMASHFLVLDPSYSKSYQTVFLIRDPLRIITSYSKVILKPTAQDIGVSRQAELYRWYREHGLRAPIVLDSNDVLSSPEQHLKSLCLALDLPFAPEMLSWAAGPKPYDGVWAPYWYGNVHQSTGFEKQASSHDELPTQFEELFQTCKRDYDFLYKYSITNKDHATGI